MTPDDPRHGIYAGAQAHMRERGRMCEPCRLAFRRYQNRADNERKLGKLRRVPAGPVVDHVRALVATGTPITVIAAKSGVGRSTITDALAGYHSTMLADLAQSVLAVTPAPHPNARVDATGTRRRVQALGCLGWSYTAIARETKNLGQPVTERVIRQFMVEGSAVTVRTARAVAAVYGPLSVTPAPHDRATSCVRVRAKAKGYVPPLAWDNIDDPNEKPRGIVTGSLRDNHDDIHTTRAADLEHLAYMGASLDGALDQLGLDRRSLEKWCARNGRTDLFQRLAAPYRRANNQHTKGAA